MLTGLFCHINRQVTFDTCAYLSQARANTQSLWPLSRACGRKVSGARRRMSYTHKHAHTHDKKEGDVVRGCGVACAIMSARALTFVGCMHMQRTCGACPPLAISMQANVVTATVATLLRTSSHVHDRSPNTKLTC